MHTFWQDVRYAGRMLRRSPGFTIVAIVMLSLGIGANTAIFSVMDALMLRDLPVRDPGQLVEVFSHYPGEPRRNGFPLKFYEHYRDRNHVFSDLIGILPGRVVAHRGGSDVDQRAAGRAVVSAEAMEYVTGNLFPALGVRPAAGRLITAEDDRPGHETVAVLSWRYWQRRFNLDPSVINTSIVVNGRPVTVIGVAPAPFVGLRVGVTPDVWAPIALAPKPPGVAVVGRLAPGVTLEQALAEMRVLDQWRVAEMTKANTDPRWRELQITLEPAGHGLSQLRDQFSNQVLILMALVVLLLLMACTTIGSMLLARGAARRGELAVRVALGASRMRIVRQVATEAALLVLTGSVFGVVLAYAGATTLVQSWRPDPRGGWGNQPVDISVGPDVRLLLFTLVVAVLTGLLFVLPSARHACAVAPATTLRGARGHGWTGLRGVFGQSFVVAQVAVSMMLVTAAALFVGHLVDLRSVERLGFRRDSVLLITLDPRNSGYPPEQLLQFYEDLLLRIEAFPTVHSATLSGTTPIEGGAWSQFVRVEGVDERPEDRRYVSVNAVAPKFFETLGTPLIAGRDFRADDRRGPPVAIINQAMARHYFPSRTPLGRHVRFDPGTISYEIVGVAGDAKYAELHEPIPRTLYLDALQDQRARFSQLALRTTVPPTSIVGDVRRAVDDIMKGVRIAKVTTLADQVDAAMRPERTIASLSGLFGAVAAVLAAVGLYGLLSYTVARRVHEIGIRMALGATRRDVSRLVLTNTLRLVAAGLVIGGPIALASRPLAAKLVIDLAPGSVMPAGAAAAMLIGVALLAAYLPARRASRVDPMVALRHE